jgi:predicted O-methyltransferase YrrM
MRLAIKPDNLLDRFALLGNLAPEPLVETQIALISARAIMAATELGVFSALLNRQLAADEIATGCGLNKKATEALLGALASIGYLRFRQGRFSLTRKSRKWLAPKEGWSLFQYMPHVRDVWRWAARLEDFLRDGKALDIHAEATTDEWYRYQRAMRSLAEICAVEVAQRLAVPAGAKRMLDIGGAHGFYSVALCRKHPGLNATILDLETAIENAAPILAAERMEDRVTHQSGDALTTDLGENEYDLIFISQLAHHFSNDQNKALVDRAARALVSGGMLVIQEAIRPQSPGSGDQISQTLNLFFAMTSTSGTWSIDQIQTWHRAASLAARCPVFLRSAPGVAQVSGVKH